MTTSEPDPAARVGLAALAAVQACIGAWMVIAPGSFSSSVAAFGVRNDHLVRDLASWELALAAVAAVAIRRPGWRVPVLAVALAHWTLHAVNHAIDVGKSDPGWIGPFDLVTILAGTAGLAWLLGRVRRGPLAA